MPGMNTGLRTNDPTIGAAFRAMLVHEGLIVLLLLALLALGWNAFQAIRIRGEAKGRAWHEVRSPTEPIARRLLRLSFGFIWIFDGLLQGQQSMPLGMTTQVIQPSAAASPSWCTTPRQRRRHDLEQSSDHCSGVGRVDPGGAWPLALGRSPGPLVTARWTVQCRLGTRRVGVWRELRRHLCARAHVGVRCARRRPVLLRCRPAHCSPGTRMAEPSTR